MILVRKCSFSFTNLRVIGTENLGDVNASQRPKDDPNYVRPVGATMGNNMLLYSFISKVYYFCRFPESLTLFSL